jgi:hypothetical protein
LCPSNRADHVRYRTRTRRISSSQLFWSGRFHLNFAIFSMTTAPLIYSGHIVVIAYASKRRRAVKIDALCPISGRSMKFENEIDFSSNIYIEIPFTWIEIDKVVVKMRKKPHNRHRWPVSRAMSNRRFIPPEESAVSVTGASHPPDFDLTSALELFYDAGRRKNRNRHRIQMDR